MYCTPVTSEMIYKEEEETEVSKE